MFLNTTLTTHTTRKSFNPRRMAQTALSTAASTLVEQTRRLRIGHLSFVLGLTVAVTAAVSLGAFESGASPARPQDARQATRGIAVSKVLAGPIYFVLADSQDEANQLLAEAYYLQTEASGSVALPTVRVIGSAEDDQHLQDELSTMTYHGVAYRITDLRAK